MSRTPLDLLPIKQREIAAEDGPWVNGGGVYILRKAGGPIADDFHEYGYRADTGRPPDAVARIRGTGRLTQRFGDSEAGQAKVRAAEIANLEFLAHARTDIPALVREVEYGRNVIADKDREIAKLKLSLAALTPETALPH